VAANGERTGKRAGEKRNSLMRAGGAGRRGRVSRQSGGGPRSRNRFGMSGRHCGGVSLGVDGFGAGKGGTHTHTHIHRRKARENETFSRVRSRPPVTVAVFSINHRSPP